MSAPGRSVRRGLRNTTRPPTSWKRVAQKASVASPLASMLETSWRLTMTSRHPESSSNRSRLRSDRSSSPFVNWPFRSKMTTLSRCRCSICSFTEATPPRGRARQIPTLPLQCLLQVTGTGHRGGGAGPTPVLRYWHRRWWICPKIAGLSDCPVTHLALTIKSTPVQSCSASKSWRGGSVKLLLTRTPP